MNDIEMETHRYRIKSGDVLFSFLGTCAKSESVAEVSRRTKISLAQLYRIFGDKKADPGFRKALKICEALDMTLWLEYKMPKEPDKVDADEESTTSSS